MRRQVDPLRQRGMQGAMNFFTTKTFKSGDSEAVRLPEELSFGVDVEVEIIRRGDEVTIRPKREKKTMQELVAALRALPKPDRPMKRERIIFPKRKGL